MDTRSGNIIRIRTEKRQGIKQQSYLFIYLSIYLYWIAVPSLFLLSVLKFVDFRFEEC